MLIPFFKKMKYSLPRNRHKRNKILSLSIREMMDEKRYIELLAKKYAGELTLSERRDLLKFENATTEKTISGQWVDEIFQAPVSFEESVGPELPQKAYASISERINREAPVLPMRKSSFSTRLRLIAAAVFLIVAGASFWLIGRLGKTETTDQVVSTEKGSKTKVLLPDGTVVQLNAATQLSYQPTYGKTTREVTLTGEAFFDVVKDKDRPFIVHTETMDVKVLGTAFNIRAYENETTEQTTLIRGKVDVLLKKQNNQIISLAPNEKITVSRFLKNVAKPAGPTTAPQEVFLKTDLNAADSSAYETGWISNRLVFRQENFDEIVAALERWYNVKITVKRTPNNKKFRGTFQNDSIEDVLKAFQASAGIQYKIEKDSITIY